MDDEECAIRIMWEGLEVEASCPSRMFADTLGMVGNEMLRLNAALVVMGDPVRAIDATETELK